MTTTEIAEIAAKHNLLLMRVVKISSIEESIDLEKQRLEQWQDQGYAGTMSYMQRDPEIFFDFNKFLPNAKTILSFSIPYSNASVGQVPTGYGRVARYAWGRDYHKVIKKRLDNFCVDLKSSYPEINTRNFTDSVPLLERFIAQSSGGGFIGKNTLHIIPSVGSFTFLSEVLIDIELDCNTLTKKEPDVSPGCKSCSRCLDSCPTKAFPEPFVLDANRCISYLTIEYKGIFSKWQRNAIGEWLFGCDICQEVCPFNHKGIDNAPDPQLVPEDGNGPFLEFKAILEIASEEAFLKRFAGTPLMRAGYTGLIRNCCAVVANKMDFELLPQILNLLNRENEIITASAANTLLEMSQFLTGSEKRKIDHALTALNREN